MERVVLDRQVYAATRLLQVQEWCYPAMDRATVLCHAFGPTIHYSMLTRVLLTSYMRIDKIYQTEYGKDDMNAITHDALLYMHTALRIVRMRIICLPYAS